MTKGLRYLICLLLILLVSAPVLANSAPPRWDGDRVSVLVPDTSSPVVIYSQELTLQISAELDKAYVVSTYVMKNPSEQLLVLPVLFVALADQQDVQVVVDGSSLSVESFSMADVLMPQVQTWCAEHPALVNRLTALAVQTTRQGNEMEAVIEELQAAGVDGASERQAQDLSDYCYWLAQESDPVPYSIVMDAAQALFPTRVAEMEAGWVGERMGFLDPVNGQSYSAQSYGGPQAIRFTEFEISFRPGQERLLQVSYEMAAAVDRVKRLNEIYNYQYLFHPARAWAGYGQLRVSVQAPKNIYWASNLPFEEVRSAGRGTKLEMAYPQLPGGNLAIAVMEKGALGSGAITGEGVFGFVAGSLLGKNPIGLFFMSVLGGFVVVLGGLFFLVRYWLNKES
ncbi:MAG TPA: hypothetical protein GXZ96_06775 [Firmicutes bacterium]|nr:hypothetical protein [Bacillota bacterium]